MSRYREEIECKPERDAVTCSVCDAEGEVATPAGAMCEEHADEYAEALR